MVDMIRDSILATGHASLTFWLECDDKFWNQPDSNNERVLEIFSVLPQL